MKEKTQLEKSHSKFSNFKLVTISFITLFAFISLFVLISFIPFYKHLYLYLIITINVLLLIICFLFFKLFKR